MKILKVFILLFCFFGFAELAFIVREKMNGPSNRLEVVDNKNAPTSNNSDTTTLYFIGDSFAQTGYLPEGYPAIFQKFAQHQNLQFSNLARSATELDYHIYLMDSLLSLDNKKMILYFYNIADIVSLDQSTFVNKNVRINNQQKKKAPAIHKRLITAIRMANTTKYAKDVMHKVSMGLTGKPTMGSNKHKFAEDSYKSKGSELVEKFAEWDKKGIPILILVNYHLHFDSNRMRDWYVYSFFEELKNDHFDNISIYQSIDFLHKDSGNSVSWRNGHPHQSAVFEIADSLKQQLRLTTSVLDAQFSH